MIPVIINNRDLLTNVQAQAAFFSSIPGVRLIIADNDSSYPPLLEWYKTCPYEVIPLGGNQGPRGGQQVLGFCEPYEYYFLADPDIDFTGVPTTILDLLVDGLERYPYAQGAGVGLKIDDLPDTPIAKTARDIESKYWEKRVDHDFYWAPNDTAAVLRRRDWGGGYEGIRTAEITARHLPWYHTRDNRPDDFRWFLYHCDTRGTFYTPRIRTML